MIHPNDYGALRAFAAVAEQLSFSRAAEDLGVSSSALSQAIRGLEERLAQRLLNRTTRSVSLTEAGTSLLAGVEDALAALSVAFEAARTAGAEPAGTVRLHCFNAAAELFVRPLLRDFIRTYPRVTLDLMIDDRVVDIVGEGFDAAIRIGEVVDKDMVAIALGGAIRQVAVASPTYLAARGIPQTPKDLLGHDCIRWRWPGRSNPYEWEFCENGRWFAVGVDGPLIASSRSFTLNAALDGIGIAFLKEGDVEQFVSEGRLVKLLEQWSLPFPGFYLCFPRQRQMLPAVRTVIDALAAAGSNIRQ